MNNHLIRAFKAAGCGLITLGACAGPLSAASVPIPNGSFELPATDFAAPDMAGWEKAPQPFWYTDTNFPWVQLVGQFLNTSNGSPNYITNVEGNQAAFLFALPDVAIFQDYNTISGTNSRSSREFNAQFEAGKSYAFTIGVLGGGGGMGDGATLEIALYFRDAAGNMVTVGATTITNTDALFPTNTHLTDFEVRIPFVKATDAWAGKRIGVRVASTLSLFNPALFGGYWDIDNVRLTESVVPNYSFESPVTDFAYPDMDSWQKAPQPFWYTDTNFLWFQLMGQFLNTSNGSPDHFDNVEGRQAAYLFALPDVAIYQDYNTVGGTNPQPARDFNAQFEPGKSYALTVGVAGGGGGMVEGVPFEISLYYRDAASNIVTVASTFVTNTDALFPAKTHFTDFQARVPQVKPTDAWAGKNIGIKLASALTLLDFGLFGGYWDIDNVRLTESALPNHSFESPETDFAAPYIDSWQKSAQPGWYTDTNFPWFALTGQFLNTTNGSSDHIDNVDGEQGAYLFALPDVALFQDYISIGGFDVTPMHDFSLKYERGNSYNMTVGVLGAGGAMLDGVPFVISFYYRDAANNRVTISSTTITNSKTLFPTNTHLTDFQVQVPTVKGTEPWAGKYIGVQLASGLTLMDFGLFGGYWDLDNVRLQVVRDPVLNNPSVNTNRQFQFTLSSAPGQYEVLTSPSATAPVASWIRLGIFTNVTGTVSVTDTNLGIRFYQARPSP